MPIPACRGAALALLLPWLLAACGGVQFEQRRGDVMGTYYVVQAACSNEGAVDRAVAALHRVNDRLTTYQDDSELMAFNRSPLHAWQNVGRDVSAVLQLAERVHAESGGALNPSIGQLIELWGFGRDARIEPPTDAAISALLPAALGFEVAPDGRARRTANVMINLSAVAKGYGVDLAAAELADSCAHYMVDVGGEVQLRGMSPKGRPWRIGIERPDAGQSGVAQVLALSEGGVATSGDYRNYREVDGERYSHTLDPRTGRPITHTLASVTVVHRSTALADAYATAINVLGPEEGMLLAQQLRLAAYLIVRAEGQFEVRYTGPMEQHLAVAARRGDHTAVAALNRTASSEGPS